MHRGRSAMHAAEAMLLDSARWRRQSSVLRGVGVPRLFGLAAAFGRPGGATCPRRPALRKTATLPARDLVSPDRQAGKCPSWIVISASVDAVQTAYRDPASSQR